MGPDRPPSPGTPSSDGPDFGLDDPARRRRWEAESAVIRLDLTDERFFRRRRAAWILLVAFLLAVIGFAIWTIFATTRWWGLKVFGQLEPRVLGVERDIPRSAAW